MQAEGHGGTAFNIWEGKTDGIASREVVSFPPGTRLRRASYLRRQNGLGGVVIDLRGDDPIVEVTEGEPTGLLGASRSRLFAKRFIDVTGALVALVLFAPLLALVALAVKLTSPGPVFYVSDRVGKDGESFRFLKFRTMRTEADIEKPMLLELNDVDGPIFKIKDDPRITPLGRFLRRSSLDELPQLVHVLSGKMSLVGPRPPIPEEVAEYSVYHMSRLAVKPGLTCLWQVSGRSTLDFETWVEMDLEYIDNWSLGYDLRLIARTFPAVLSGRGAF